MNVAVAIVGLAVLLALAIAVGILRADEIAQQNAWRAIASARREVRDEQRRRREFDELRDRCRNCPFRQDPAA